MFWTNDKEEITPNRFRSLNQFKEISEVDVILITKDNLHEYILPENPLHPSYKYLSAVHRSDYLRTYFMHFYGGGYSDIKKTTGSWRKSFDDLYNSDKFIIGYGEKSPNDIAGPRNLQVNYKHLIGNCAYICKPQTEFTKEWYDLLIKILDLKLLKLKQSPAFYSRDHSKKSKRGYPIGWSEILGSIFHPLCFKHRANILKGLPSSIFVNYL